MAIREPLKAKSLRESAFMASVGSAIVVMTALNVMLYALIILLVVFETSA